LVFTTRVPPSRWNSRLLQHAQEFGLRRGAHLAHFVEKQHTRRRQLDLPGLALVGAGERSTLVAEQFRFDQRFRQRGAVDRHKRAVLARRAPMNQSRDNFLAGARFALQEHRRSGRGNLHGLLEHVAPACRLPDDRAALRVPVQHLHERLASWSEVGSQKAGG
jgi:hypothetical protein